MLAIGAASFNGVSPDFLGTPSSSDLQVSAQDFSFVFWYNISVAPGAFTAFFNKGNNTAAGDDWGVQIDNSNNISAFLSDGVAYSAQSLVALTANGTWQFIYAGWNQASLLWESSVNGSAIANGAVQTHAPQSTANAFQMGIAGDRTTRQYLGKLDGVGFWKRRLTQAEVNQLFVGIKIKNIGGSLKTSLTAGWDLDGPSKTGKWNDAVSTNNLTNTGGVTVVAGRT